MNNLITINMHNLFYLQIDKNNPWVDDIISSFGDTLEIMSWLPVSSNQKNTKLPLIQIVYTPYLSTDGMRSLGQKIFIGKNDLIDRNYGVHLKLAPEGSLSLQVDNAGLELLVWLMQLSLLKSRATFVHAMGVEKEGKAILFPSWGGVGKTAIAKGFVHNLGWKLLGDDMVILSEEGLCYGYPKPMVVYPYHKKVFPSVFEQGKGPVAPIWMNTVLTKTALMIKPLLRTIPGVLQFARRHNPQSTRVKPSKVFGQDKLATKAKLQTVIWLDRVANISKPILFPAGQSLPSRVFGSTLRELDPSGANLLHIACGLGIISANDIYPLWIDVLSKGLENVDGWILYIPSDVPVHNVFDVVQKTMRDSTIGEL